MMYHRKRTALAISLTLLFALLLASCSGSGSSGSQAPIGGVSLSPLVVADRVSVVDAQNTSAKPAAKAAPTGIKSLLAGLNIISNPLAPTTDYMLDVPMVYVNERAAREFGDINSILCAFKQTRYDEMINQGPYLAMLDFNLCNNDASNSTDASGSSKPNYVLWTVQSTRESETSPHIVDIWFLDMNPYNAEVNVNGQFVVGQLIITEGADTAPPYGKFQINFFAIDPVTGIEIDRGMLISNPDPKTGESLLQYADETTDFSVIKKATLRKAANGFGGGTVLGFESEQGIPTAMRFDIGFNSALFMRHNHDFTIPDVCLDRTRFDESAWRYGLYDQSGMRVNVNSGFSIMKDGKYGWVGYWGVWMDNATLASGDTVYQHDFSTNTDTPYTIFQAGGKLKKHMKKSLTLGSISNVPLFWWNSTDSTSYQVVWDGLAFTPKSKEVPSSDPYSPPEWWPCDGTTTICPSIDLNTLQSTELNFWSQSLGGQVRVPLDNCTISTFYYICSASDATNVVIYTEDIVYPGDAIPSALRCYDNCPKADGASGITNPDTITWAVTSDPTTGASIHYRYSFDPATMLLSDVNGPIIITTAGVDNQWGLSTGALVDPATPNLAALLDCNWDGDGDPSSSPAICGWNAWSLDVFYTWETGPSDWNKFTGLKDSSGNFVRFDPPLRVQYVHNEAGSPYNGGTFFLEYNGFGNLQGIPGGCVDANTGEPTDYCDNTTMWVPEFSIPDDDGAGNLTEVTGPGSVQYIVKALDKEQRMQPANPADPADITPCTAAGVTATPQPLPSMTLWRAPTSGPMPEVTTAPKVIGGVVQ